MARFVISEKGPDACSTVLGFAPAMHLFQNSGYKVQSVSDADLLQVINNEMKMPVINLVSN